MPKACDQESRVFSLTRTGTGRYAGEVADEGNGTAPCAMAAAMLSAALDLSGPNVSPVSITTYLMADLCSGPCEVIVKWVRGNGSLQCWRAELRQEFAVASSQILLTGDLPSSSYLPFASDGGNAGRCDTQVAVSSPYSGVARALAVSSRDLMGEDCESCSVAIRFHEDSGDIEKISSLAVEYDVPRSCGEVMSCDVRLVGPSGLAAAATYAFLRSQR